MLGLMWYPDRRHTVDFFVKVFRTLEIRHRKCNEFLLIAGQKKWPVTVNNYAFRRFRSVTKLEQLLA